MSQVKFQKTYGISSEEGKSIIQTQEGNYVFAGYTNGFGVTESILLIKTNPLGDTLWSRAYNHSGFNFLVTRMKQTADDGFILTGNIIDTGSYIRHICLLKVDGNGNLQWSKRYYGTSQEESNSVQQTTDGGYILCGYTSSFGAGQRDACLIKTDATGTIQWQRTYGSIFNESGFYVEQTTDNGFILSGYVVDTGASPMDILLIKTDSNGNLIWNKKIGSIYDDNGISVQQEVGGYSIISTTQIYDITFVPSLYSKFDLVKVDKNGNLIWARRFGEFVLAVNDGCKFGRKTNDGGYVLTGTPTGCPCSSYLIKTDSNGVINWSKTYGMNGDWGANDIIQTIDNGYIMAGSTMVAGPNDIYLIKTDANGNSGCYQNNGSFYDSIIVLAETSPTILIGTSSFTETLLIPSTYSGCLTNTICTSVPASISEHFNPSSILLLSPNPTTSQLTIQTQDLKLKELHIYNVLGELVKQSSIPGHPSSCIIDVSDLKNGMYFIETTSETARLRSKFIKQ